MINLVVKIINIIEILDQIALAIKIFKNSRNDSLDLSFKKA